MVRDSFFNAPLDAIAPSNVLLNSVPLSIAIHMHKPSARTPHGPCRRGPASRLPCATRRRGPSPLLRAGPSFLRRLARARFARHPPPLPANSVSAPLRSPLPALPATCFARLPSAPSPLTSTQSRRLHRSSPASSLRWRPASLTLPVARAPSALLVRASSRLSHGSPPPATSPHSCRPPRCPRRRHAPPHPRRPPQASAPRRPPVSAPLQTPLPALPAACFARLPSTPSAVPSTQSPWRLPPVAFSGAHSPSLVPSVCRSSPHGAGFGSHTPRSRLRVCALRSHGVRLPAPRTPLSALLLLDRVVTPHNTPIVTAPRSTGAACRSSLHDRSTPVTRSQCPALPPLHACPALRFSRPSRCSSRKFPLVAIGPVLHASLWRPNPLRVLLEIASPAARKNCEPLIPTPDPHRLRTPNEARKQELRPPDPLTPSSNNRATPAKTHGITPAEVRTAENSRTGPQRRPRLPARPCRAPDKTRLSLHLHDCDPDTRRHAGSRREGATRTPSRGDPETSGHTQRRPAESRQSPSASPLLRPAAAAKTTSPRP